ncbi:MAG: CerR family C-terminal domain-containing protein [Proteobacteria bacterium]|nr:CerR family C-terminal domain-containing protein [Pseudomonadota bacterium]
MPKPVNSHEPTKTRILEAAETLFAEKGYAAVSVREITAAAGVHLAAVNYHFGSKKRLYFAMFEQRLLPRVMSVRPPIEALLQRGNARPAEMIKTLVRSILENPWPDDRRQVTARLISRELSQPTEMFDILIETYFRPMVQMIARLLSPFLGPDMTEESLLLNTLSTIAQITYFSNGQPVVTRLTGRPYDADFIDQLVGHITDFSLRGLGLERKPC